MPPVVRMGDANNMGGKIIVGVPNVLVNNRPICVDGKPITAHYPYVPPHVSAVTTAGLKSVIAGGIPINLLGNPDSCGHTRVEGSDNVVGG
ncbi:COG4104 Uncharacterized conserved protein [uncultured Caudovirales phage]|uniref:COG4104 Uncharacterized conserved protein n=1 Tax=uncultured Caudovirales phage TaxID=2100421 RepID=A0A6J5T0W8_9CAUD|nr:COG4104 Uncharacterized conserved protein [uncultured Caudovirales phage]